MSDLFPRMKVFRPSHPGADADGNVGVTLETYAGEVIAATGGYGDLPLTELEQVEAGRLWAERMRWVNEVADRAEARNG